MARDPDYIEPAWREGLREIAAAMLVCVAVAILLGVTVRACTQRHPSEQVEPVKEWRGL